MKKHKHLYYISKAKAKFNYLGKICQLVQISIHGRIASTIKYPFHNDIIITLQICFFLMDLLVKIKCRKAFMSFPSNIFVFDFLPDPFNINVLIMLTWISDCI